MFEILENLLYRATKDELLFTKLYPEGTQKNSLNEKVLVSIKNMS